MRIGVDFGTTRTLVALSDRGNYPVVTFSDEFGDQHEFVPTVVARDPESGELRFGSDAVGMPGAVRSFKRHLAAHDVSPHTTIDVGGQPALLLDVVTGFLAAVRHQLETTSTIAGFAGREPLEAVISVPAHAHGAQRFLTLQAYQRAGFEVLALINEPSAAGFEFTHRLPRTVTSRRNRVVVYDLGGGTFDASLLQAESATTEGANHEVLSSVGVNQLGGDDFDEVLARLALDAAGLEFGSLTPEQWADVRLEAREAKERINPQTRRIYLDVLGESVAVPVDEFHEAAAPLVEQTLEAMGPLIGELGEDSEFTSVAGIYLVGGGSSLPLVARQLRERFGRRVHRSPYPAASTAIGLAIAADPDSGYTLIDRLSRGFGVYRERDAGAQLGFDELVDRLAVMRSGEETTVTRRYRAAHNLGYYRFVEYAALGDDGQPRGEVVPFAEVLFAFDEGLRDGRDLSQVEVVRTDHGPEIEEAYTIDRYGMVEVAITDLDSGYRQEYCLNA